MKKLLLILGLAIALSAAVALFPARASAAEWYCVINPGQSCSSGFNYWNHHYVRNLGSSVVYCSVTQPNGTVQSTAWVNPGQEKTLSAWVYNHITCQNHGTSQTTLDIVDY